MPESGPQVHFFPWIDDFAAARNESLRHAQGSRLFWMDSDDTLPAECGRQLRELALAPNPDNVLGFVMLVHCPGPEGTDGGDMTVVDHVKLRWGRGSRMGIPNDQLCDELRRQFIATLGDAPISWWRVWTLFVQHDCYQALLDQCARRLIYQHNIPREWLDDVKQDAILILASKLRKAPNLHYNPDRPASSFTPWLRTVVRSHCQDAIRGLRSCRARQLPLLSDPPEKLSAVDQRIDLHIAMLRASARERAALSLFAQGYTDGEIAQRLKLTIGQARALRLRGLRFLALLLSPASSSAP